MRPLERRQEFLLQKGYLIVRGFFSAEEIAEVATAQDAFYQGGFDSEPEFRWPLPRPCNARSRKHPYASFFLSPLAKLLRDGRLAKLVKESLGTPSIRFWHDQLLYEEPKPSAPLDYHWHREKSRWLTCAASQMATAWIPLTEFTHEMGPITIVPSGKEHPAMKRMVLRAGDLVIFPADTLHGNPPNYGDNPRRAVAAHFASGDLHYRKAGKFKHVNERVVREKDGLPDFTDERVCPLLEW
ncbi:MAG: phytanoyl-CoA dioxygenase family protein [Akkermansiaceae bacterium]